MEKETNCINSRAILDYLKHHQVDCSALCRGLDPDIDSLENPESFLRDPDNWISCGVISKLYRRAVTILNDENAAYKIGKFTAENISLGYVQRIILKSFWSIRRALGHVQKINDQLNRSKKKSARNRHTQKHQSSDTAANRISFQSGKPCVLPRRSRPRRAARFI